MTAIQVKEVILLESGGLMGSEGRRWKETQESSLVLLIYFSYPSQLLIQARSTHVNVADLTKTPCGAHSYAVTTSVVD
jgi:hypothetical protein